MTKPLLTVSGLDVRLPAPQGTVQALTRLDLTVHRGEFLGVVGESGCGKTTFALAVLGLLPRTADVHGMVRLDEDNLPDLTERRLRRIRGNRIGYIPQDPLAALDPTFPIGDQIAQAVRAHRDVSRREAREAALELMARAGMVDADRCYRLAPHELSGGMRQRVTIAIAMANSPELILADEPTTALDATIQHQILELLRKLATENGTAVVLITHDLTVVSRFCTRVAVLYAGHLVELGPTAATFGNPRHPYTRALLRSMPSAGQGAGDLDVIRGEVPDLRLPIQGCPFGPRCGSHAQPCEARQPLLDVAPGHATSCWREGVDDR